MTSTPKAIRLAPGYLIAAGIEAVLIALAWFIFFGVGRQQGEWVLFIAASIGAVVGGRAILAAMYGGDGLSARARLTLAGFQLANPVARGLLFLAAVAVGSVAVRAFLPAGLIVEGMGVNAWNLVLMTVLVAALGAMLTIALIFIVVVPIGFVAASFMKPELSTKPSNAFAVMSNGELRGGSIAIVSGAMLGVSLWLVFNGAGPLWIAVAALTLVLTAVGLIVNYRAVQVRRLTVETDFDDGLFGIRRRR